MDRTDRQEIKMNVRYSRFAVGELELVRRLGVLVIKYASREDLRIELFLHMHYRTYWTKNGRSRMVCAPSLYLHP